MNICGVIFSLFLVGQVPQPEIPESLWNKLTKNTQEVNILKTEIKSLRERVAEHDRIIYMINRNLLGIQNNIGSQENINTCPYKTYRNYIDVVLGILAVFGLIGLYNTIAGIFKKKPITIDPSFLSQEKKE